MLDAKGPAGVLSAVGLYAPGLKLLAEPESIGVRCVRALGMRIRRGWDTTLVVEMTAGRG